MIDAGLDRYIRVRYNFLNGTGNQIGLAGLGALQGNGTGDPTGSFNTWAFISLDPAGIGRSIVLGADTTAIAFDDMGFTLVPAPAGLALLGLGGAAIRRRRDRKKPSAINWQLTT